MKKSHLYLILLLAACHPRTTFPPGGYPYPKYVADKDTGFYYYPLKDEMSRRDSFRHGWDSVLFNAFDEPNLGLRPLPAPVFRLYYAGWREGQLIVSLTPTEITIKSHEDSHFKYRTDTTRLDALERRQAKFFERFYGIDTRNDTGRRLWRPRYIDSMERIYPQLKDPAYYWQLMRKELVTDPDAIKYTSFKRAILPAVFQNFVDVLNASGYWQMPYKRECNIGVADGPPYFALEANTPQKYNFVSGYSCPNDTNNFYKACQQLIRYAGLEKKFDLIWIEKPPDTTSKYSPIVVQDVQLEDIKEPQKPKHHHPIKKPHPN